jgi:amino acid transporter
LIFSKLTVAHPGDGGMTVAIEKVLGRRFKILASLLMMTAVSFGPTAVMLTAANYLGKLKLFQGISVNHIAMALVLACLLLLMKELKFISTLSLVTSVVIGLVLFMSSVVSLTQNGVQISPLSIGEWMPLGKTVMLLFWAIIGWEIVGNYAMQVKDLKKTIPRATALSLVAVTIIYLIIALAVQSFPYTKGLSLVDVLMPVFGQFSEIVLALLITGLCVSTYLLIVGALARLVYDLSQDGFLPKFLAYKNKNEVPFRGVLYFSMAHLLVLTLVSANVLSLEVIVTIANGFFLANALIGLVASYGVVDGWLFKIGAAVLMISLIVLILFSNPWIWLALVLEFILVWSTQSEKRRLK